MLSWLTISIYYLTCRWASWLIFFRFVVLFNTINIAQARPRNITISNDSPQIVYTPFLCTVSSIDPDPQCVGAWQLFDLNGKQYVSTSGPDPASGNIIPQIFLQFRASALYLITSPFSNAIANITLSENDISVNTAFNSSIGVVAAVNLHEAEITTLVITFVPTPGSPSRLDIGPMIITVADNAASTVILPSTTPPSTQTLPTTLPTTIVSSIPSPVQNTSKHTQVAEGVGIVIGLGLGLTAVTVTGYICWRRRRRRRQSDTHSEASSETQPPQSSPLASRPSKIRIGEKVKAWF